MKLPLYQIDAFTDTVFKGNPACVVYLEDQWLSDEIMQSIAAENAVAETAFFRRREQDHEFDLRWFTPEIEMDLCGHATLATAHCIHTILKADSDVYTFHTASGELKVRIDDQHYLMDFPSRMPVQSDLPAIIASSLSAPPLEVHKSRDYLLVYATQEDVEQIQIDRNLFDTINLDPGGVIITAPGDDCDFVSRFFTPQASILEDPVTGSAHCSLIPFWANRLQKQDMIAQQVSERGGHLICHNKGERVIIGGKATTYLVGEIYL